MKIWVVLVCSRPAVAAGVSICGVFTDREQAYAEARRQESDYDVWWKVIETSVTEYCNL